MVATFDQLDTVRDASVLDATDDITKLSSGSLESKQKRAAVELKTEVFLNAIISPVMNVIGRAPLRMVTGMLGLLLERNNINLVVKSKVSFFNFCFRFLSIVLIPGLSSPAWTSFHHHLPQSCGIPQASDSTARSPRPPTMATNLHTTLQRTLLRFPLSLPLHPRFLCPPLRPELLPLGTICRFHQRGSTRYRFRRRTGVEIPGCCGRLR